MSRRVLASIGPVVVREQLAEAVSIVPRAHQTLDGPRRRWYRKDGLSAKPRFADSHNSTRSSCLTVSAAEPTARLRTDGTIRSRGLVHIANVLACRGLCDPILPGSVNTQVIFDTFRKRLAQCVRTIRSVSPDRELVLFIDAIDNAAEYAKESNSQAFPTLLLKSIKLSGPIPGVTVITSGRTHRIRKYISKFFYHDFELHAFTVAESTEYLTARMRVSRRRRSKSHSRGPRAMGGFSNTL